MKGASLLLIGCVLFITLSLVFSISNTISQENKCDLKKIEVAYGCPQCDKIYENPGKCEECSKSYGEDINPEKIEVCVKTGYVCESCGKKSLKPGTCEKCKTDLTAKTVKAQIVYRCPQCDWDYNAPGICEDCKTDDGAPVKLEKTCKHSGVFPHVSE